MSTEDNPTPQFDALRAMQKIFSDDEIKRLAAICEQVRADMFGEVVIRYEHGEPHFIVVKSEVYRRVKK